MEWIKVDIATIHYHLHIYYLQYISFIYTVYNDSLQTRNYCAMKMPPLAQTELTIPWGSFISSFPISPEICTGQLFPCSIAPACLTPGFPGRCGCPAWSFRETGKEDIRLSCGMVSSVHPGESCSRALNPARVWRLLIYNLLL